MVLYMKNICECAFSTIHNKFLAYAFIDNSFLQNLISHKLIQLSALSITKSISAPRISLILDDFCIQ